MKRNIFYSWQSDLPNSTNRGFIQESIEKAVDGIGQEKILLNIVVDRDTKGVTGTPDISSSIFNKIDSTHIFIGDISIINSSSTDRKTPNPNVLVELGYAAKTIGWNNVICVFNTEYGKIEDLPFDLRFRRPLTYQITNKGNKVEDKRLLTQKIKSAIQSIIESEVSKDEIRLFIKQQVDKEILGICNQINKIVYGLNRQSTLDNIWQLLSLTSEDLEKELFERKYIGFTISKDWKEFLGKIQALMNQPFFTHHAEPGYISGLIKVVKALETITVVFNSSSLLIDTGLKVKGYKVVSGIEMSLENPKDSYILLKELPETSNGMVVDFGTIRKYNMPKVLNYLVVNKESFLGFSLSIHELITGISVWVTNTGNYIIIDPLNFRV